MCKYFWQTMFKTSTYIIWIIVICNVFINYGTLHAEHSVHAFINADIILDPGHTIKNGILVIRDGIIENVGENIPIPKDARIWDLNNRVICPGWINLFQPISGLRKNKDNSGKNTGKKTHDLSNKILDKYWVETLPSVHPGYDPIKKSEISRDILSKIRAQGFTSALVVPDKGVFTGQGHLLNLGEKPLHESVVAPEIVQCISFEHGVTEGLYPVSLMGAAAIFRQTFLDINWYTGIQSYWRNGGKGVRPPYLPSLSILAKFNDKNGLYMLRADRMLDLLRFASCAEEFSLRACLVGTGKEYMRLDSISKKPYPLVIPVAFHRLPNLKDEDDELDLSIAELRHWDRAPSNSYWLEQAGVTFAFSTRYLENIDDFRKMLQIALSRGLSRKTALAALTTNPSHILGLDNRLGTIAQDKLANFLVSHGDPLDPKSVFESIWVDGKRYEPEKKKQDDNNKNESKKYDNVNDEGIEPHGKGSRITQSSKPPNDYKAPILSPSRILVRGSTIWTCGPRGKLENYSILIDNGKIVKIARNITPGKDTFVLDARNKHITPGLIDEHSHAFLTGPVNESTFSSTAEVRIADIIDSETPNIYLQLASGVTIANLFHGSANVIGGQTSVVKLRWGEPPSGLIYRNAPTGIKFALGENVKQSNWGDKYRKRFPQTRMGVERFIRARFAAARDYMKKLEEEKLLKETTTSYRPIRRNLELDTLAGILTGKIPVHSHGYRADELLMLIRLSEEYGFKLATFEHCLEGYKIANELAAHSVGASIFSDWWAYKFEVYDAIPYSAAILLERNVLVAFNSDSSEMARRLNHEAAKAIKYGGVEEEVALKLITINPAIMLDIDKWVGSLEVGKDADFVIWSEHPFSPTVVCEQTWIDGKKYFDRETDLVKRKKLADEHEELLKLARKTMKKQKK